MPKPGDVVVLAFPGVEGIKRRPAVILSSDLYHASRPDFIVGLITSQTAAALAPTDYLLLDWKAAGLRAPSAFRSFLVTIPRAAHSLRVGRLSDRDWQAVQRCLAAALVVGTTSGPNEAPGEGAPAAR